MSTHAVRAVPGAGDLHEAFHGRPNILNAIRLVLATLVIFRHAVVVLTGSQESSLAVDQVFGQLPVDGFFALSGFLIAASWTADPRPRSFLLARVVRIYPAFWLCLLLTALVVGPVSSYLLTGDLSPGYSFAEAVRYVAGNASLVMFDNGIGGTPSGVPWPGDWNASLWTLKWEFACYLGVLVLGLTGLLRRAPILAALLCTAWILQLGASLGHAVVPGVAQDAARFFLMYMCGVLLYVLAHRVPVRPALGVAAVVVTVLVACYVPGYRLLCAPLLAYGLVTVGVSLVTPRLTLRHDISYGMYIYGFPIEQLLVHHTPFRQLDPWLFSILAIVLTVPLAAASWFLLERPLSRWARSRRGRPGP